MVTTGRRQYMSMVKEAVTKIRRESTAYNSEDIPIYLEGVLNISNTCKSPALTTRVHKERQIRVMRNVVLMLLTP